MNFYILQKRDDFNRALEFYRQDIASLQTGRANSSLLDKVIVNAYGSNSALNTIGSIQVQDAKSMIVTTWDKNLLKDVEKGIIDTNLGVGVVNEGDKIRVIIPQMTEENRKHFVKELNKKHELARINLRKLRDEIKTKIEEAQSDKEITEDDKFRYLDELENKIHKLNNELKSLTDKKEKDIMTI